MAPSIPDRWLPYKACGNIIEGTRIICFKVPLRRVVQKNVVKSSEIWDIKTLIQAIPKLRAVIDLTNTARYYDAQEITSTGILYTKLHMPGRILPPETIVTQFFDAVDTYLGLDKDALVGVHCTHGLNRTGYMVCRYMRDRLKIPATEAIKRFEEARGYKIERENYLAALLGETPPPPDIGKETIVKPTVKRSNVDYRSPLNEYEDDECNRYESRKKRFTNNSRHRSDRYYSADKRDDPSIKRTKYNERYSSSRESSFQFDYKYDY